MTDFGLDNRIKMSPYHALGLAAGIEIYRHAVGLESFVILFGLLVQKTQKKVRPGVWLNSVGLVQSFCGPIIIPSPIEIDPQFAPGRIAIRVCLDLVVKKG